MQLYCIRAEKDGKTYNNYYLDVTGLGDYVPVAAKYFENKDYTNNINAYLMYKHSIIVDSLPSVR